MKKTIAFIVSLLLITLIVSGCTEGVNVDGQKQIQFSLTQKGSNENWEVTDNITGDYYNLEKSIHSTHQIEIVPKKIVDYETLTVSLKVGDKVIGFYEEGTEMEKSEFNAPLNQEGSYQVTQGTFIYFNESDTFLEKDITIVIQSGDKKEEIRLG